MGKVYKLDIDKSLAQQVLEYAGWHKGRKVDIEKIEKYYKENNYSLNEYAKKFLQEFYWIEENWFFKYIGKNGEVRIGGNDFSFSIPYDFPFDEKDYEYEINQIPKEVRDKVIPIVETGWHIGGTLWIDDKGNFYHTLYYRNDSMEKYNSIFDYLEYNFRHYLGNEIYVTFKNQRDLENNKYWKIIWRKLWKKNCHFLNITQTL